jgi:hypothetical protein
MQYIHSRQASYSFTFDVCLRSASSSVLLLLYKYSQGRVDEPSLCSKETPDNEDEGLRLGELEEHIQPLHLEDSHKC